MELGENAQAIGDFGTCIGLWPEHPWSYFNRGYVLDRSGMKSDAVADYTRAIECDPRFVSAWVNRGLAQLELKHYPLALADFDHAFALGVSGDAPLQAGRAMALEALERHDEADSAFQQAFALAGRTDSSYTRLKWSYGFSVASRLPGKAEEAFDEVLRDDPQQPQALYGKAMLAMTRGHLSDAIRFFDLAIMAAPAFVEARRYRAVVLARQHNWESATRDINWCLDRDPGSGETLNAAACVAARAAELNATPAAIERAFDLLKRALALGSGQKACEDPDLIALRRDPRFKQLTSATAKQEIATGERGSTPLQPVQ
jgi:tetratricopeptide (TPR) repeat protein